MKTGVQGMLIRWSILFVLLYFGPIFSSIPPSKPAGWDAWRFNQKIKWRGKHLDPRIPYASLVDKLLVKKIVHDEIATAKVFFATNDPREISLEKLPSTFMMKSNNASGRGILVKDGLVMATKKREGIVPKKCTNELLRRYAKKWLSEIYGSDNEKQYRLIKSMIFFEEYLEDITMELELYLFNGKVRVITLFFANGYTNKPSVSYYDENWNLFDVIHPRFISKNDPIEKPPYLEKLIAFAERFGAQMDHVRVDFFITPKEIYFGEFTFTTGGGIGVSHLNSIMGNYWDFPDPN